MKDENTYPYIIPPEAIEIARGMAEKGHSLSGVPVQQLIDDRFYWPKFEDHLRQIERFGGTIDGKTILEIGCGVGAFLLFAAKNRAIKQGWGIEKSDVGGAYGQSYKAARLLMEANHITTVEIAEGVGEYLPYPDASADIVFSSNVLEHVQDPERVMDEAWRVLSPGGILQAVVPNYASWWEGHYGIIWLPFLNKFFGRWYLRLLGRDPDDFMDLRLIRSSFFLRWERSKKNLQRITMGEDIFTERLESFDAGYANLTRLAPILLFVRRFRLQSVLARCLNACRMYTPIVYTARKSAA